MKIFRNKLAVTIVLLSVTFLALITYSVKKDLSSPIGNGVGVTINSVQGGIYNIANGVKNYGGFLFNYKEIENENAKLKKENSDLQFKLSNYDTIAVQNDSLRSMLNFTQQHSQYNYVGCDIKGKSGGAILDSFIVDKGTKDGIEKGMVVIANEGVLVGQVTKTESNWAIVSTLANENIVVGGYVQSTGENNGTVRGYTDGGNKQLAKISDLSLESKIQAGDVILTSGTGWLYPKDIKIGAVTKVEQDKTKLMTTAVLQPYVNFSNLESVFIIVPKDKRNIPGDINYR